MMRSSKFHATTALGLCLMMAPVAVSAQDDAAADQSDGLYAPLVEACRDNPETDGCDAVRARVGECVQSYDARLCEVLLADPTMDGAEDAEARAMEALEALQAEFADLPEPAGDAPAQEETAQDEAPEPVVEAAEAPADSDPVAEDPEPAEMAEAEATPEVEAVEEEARIEETQPAEAEAAEAQAAEADEAQPDGARAEETQAEEDQAADQPVDETPAAADAPQEPAPQDDVAADQDAAEAPAETAEESQPDAAAPDAESIADAEEEERALEQERARLRAEAEAMAEEAPELVVEDAPEEEFVAPVEETRELDAAEQATVDRLLEDPEVSSAVGLLGSVLASRLAPEGEEAPDDQPPAAALAAREAEEGELAAREAEEGEAEAEIEEDPEVIEESITAAQLRSSREDFASRLSLDVDAGADRARRDRRDLERAGLAALGALAVGMIVNRNRVVARSDERVVVDTGEGELELWRDDDAILLQDGSTRRIERFSDGSTRTRWIRPDGTHVVTVRDATGRVLRRERIAPDGSMVELVDDTRQYAPIDVSTLPPPRTRELRISQRTDPELALAMLREAEAEARAIERSFSLRQVRETRELRELVPLLSPEPITFETNRANVRADEAPKLLQVGRLMERLIADNPREMFLIEGHTDATGPAAYNLALSDRRAESVALALTEFFEIPPENLVVQGYGERHLRIPTLDSEVRNRRVAIRRITPLIDS